MKSTAMGTFEVTLEPQGPGDSSGGTTLGRMSIDKQFSGDLEGASRGEMLSAMTSVSGSAGYVAMERISGTLQGRSGSFVLHHKGTMDRGKQDASITVVPDSGTGELSGITGTMTIRVENDRHHYDLDYTLPED